MVFFAVGLGAGIAIAATAAWFLRKRKSLVAPENDKVRRRAKVYLYTCPIELLPDAKSEAYHHWALVFAFEDGSCRTLEGIGNDELKLVPSYTKSHPSKEGKKAHPNKEGTYYLLGVEEVSPWELREFAVNNECNGKPYLATAHNCQDWVNNIAKHLGESVREKYKNFNSLKKENPVLASIGAPFLASRNTFFPGSLSNTN